MSWSERLLSRLSRPPAALAVRVRVGDAPLADRVRLEEGALTPDLPIDLRAERVAGGWRVVGPDGPVPVQDGAATAEAGGVVVQVTQVDQRRFQRFNLDQGDLVLPVVTVAMLVLGLQVALLFSLLPRAGEEGDGWEPSPEYIARLLQGQYEGAERGVPARPTPRPRNGEAIEAFYLQPGHAGPADHIGGGENTGHQVQVGDQRRKEPVRGAPPVEAPAAEEAEEQPAPEPALDEAREVTDAAEDEAAVEDIPIAVHVDEGWGFSDWYDTTDARKDAQEIERNLRDAKELLRLDPDNYFGLQTLAYYQYIAFDFERAKRTYERVTELYPDEPGGWNNLALVYKRQGDYAKEESLYRIALTLSPMDDHALNNLAVCLAHQGRFEEALAIMDDLERLIPDDPYADLHRAKIYAAMGKEERAYRYLQKSLSAMRKLGTQHGIEYRQDIRVDPAFERMREQERFRQLLNRYYGDRAEGWWNKKKGGG